MTDPPAVDDAAELSREVVRVERLFYHVYAAEPSRFGELVRRARAAGDAALLARSLCLQSRALIGRGDHAAAADFAREGLAALDSLAGEAAREHLAARAELLRTGGNALLKLGRSGEALPLLENAVVTAEAAVARPQRSTLDELRSQHVLVRSLSNLGSALIAVREADTAVAMFERIPALAEAGADDSGLADDLLLARWNHVDALLARVRRSRAADDGRRAEADLATARELLDAVAERVGTPERTPAITGYARQGYFASRGRHFLLTDRAAEAFEMFERQIEVISREPAGGMSEWVLGIAHAGMAEAALAQGAPREALRHSVLALARFERHDEADERAPVLLVRATALRRLGEFEAAYAELEAYHALRARVEAEAAQQYAGRVTAKVGLQRARAETESHRRIAATLETLGRIGQEITANLDADAVVRILFRYVGTLLDARSFAVWLLDEAGRELTLAFGVEDGRPISAPAVPLDHPRSWVARAVRERRDIVAPPPQPGDVPATLIAGTRVLPFAIFAPLIVGDRALGALSLQTDRADAFGENERSILWALCTYSAIAFDNAAAYRELRRAMTELQQTQNELSLRTAEYERLSLTDALTGVPNRRHFMERAKIEVAEAQRNGGALTVAMLDIDHFKDINDRYGHVAGDFVLQEIARVAKDGLRSRDFLARIGGEEFALLLPGAGPAEALAIAERMRAAIERMPLRFEGCTLGVTASFGVANAHADDGSIDDAFGRADAALYRSKQAGRNRVTGDA